MGGTVSQGDGGSPPISSAALFPASPATGTVSGTDLQAALCSGGVAAVVQSTSKTSYTTPFLFQLNSTGPIGEAGAAAGFDFQSPRGATYGMLSVAVGLVSASPGEYSSPASQECGSASFIYYLLPSTTVDCSGGTTSGCPPGCRSVCSHFGCTPCAPKMQSVSYGAQGPSDCAGDIQGPVGSWHLSLTSLTSDDGGSGSGVTYFVPHGTFTATLIGGEDAGSGAATLSVTF